MKKLFCLFLIVLLVLPSAVFAEEKTIAMTNHPEEMVGLWAAYIPTSLSYGYGDQSIVVILNHDGTMYASIIMNQGETSELLQRDNHGKWTEYNGYIIFQTEGKDTYGIWEYSNDMLWLEMDTMAFGLKKLPGFDTSQMKYIGQ